MYPSTSTTTSNTIAKMPVPSASTLAGYPIPTPGFFQTPLILNNNGNHDSRFHFPEHALSPASYTDLMHKWNYNRFLASSKSDQMSDTNLNSNEYYSRNGSFHQSPSRFITMPCYHQNDDEIVLTKFRPQTLVKLEKRGEMKTVEQLTSNDLMTSAQQSQQYSSLLARVEHIGCVDKLTGKAELRFYIDEIEKTTSYHVLQEMPFFVHQNSCWSSVSPEQTRCRCGLECRQLEIGDLIIAITEQRSFPSSKTRLISSQKPNYSQQSPTKTLVDRYFNGQRTSNSLSSNKRRKLTNEKQQNINE